MCYVFRYRRGILVSLCRSEHCVSSWIPLFTVDFNSSTFSRSQEMKEWQTGGVRQWFYASIDWNRKTWNCTTDGLVGRLKTIGLLTAKHNYFWINLKVTFPAFFSKTPASERFHVEIRPLRNHQPHFWTAHATLNLIRSFSAQFSILLQQWVQVERNGSHKWSWPSSSSKQQPELTVLIDQILFTSARRTACIKMAWLCYVWQAYEFN